jgi:hypothetical protein
MNTKFKTASDFRKSLEARLQGLATKTGMDLQRLRRKVAFDRFLARIFTQEKSRFFLKGGYAMELRIANSRAKDLIDMVLLLNMRTARPDAIFHNMEKVFKMRDTHPLPQKLEKPPPEWKTQFNAMADECGLSGDMQTSFEKISEFYNTISHSFSI